MIAGNKTADGIFKAGSPLSLGRENGKRKLSWVSVVYAVTLACGMSLQAESQPGIFVVSPSGTVAVSNTFANGVCTLERAEAVEGPWQPVKNVFTTSTVTQACLTVTGAAAFYRAAAWDLAGGRAGFTNLTRAYGTLTTIAGIGGAQDVNNWLPEYEGAPATNVALSGPHIAMADRAGCIYIADKDAHAIRKIQRDGTIVTVAGTNGPGDGPDFATNGTHCALNQPNGLWVRGDGTVYILDMMNRKMRRLDTNGMITTLVTNSGVFLGARGIWVSDDESVAYFSASNVVRKWTAAGGLIPEFSTGYAELGNLVMDPWGNLVVTDRNGHLVYRLDSEGNRTVIAGNGLNYGGGDGELATNTGLNEVRGVWFLPSGAYFLATHRGSQVWYVDAEGYIHLFLNGSRRGAHAGDGTWFYNPTEPRVSECRAITMDYDGNLIITENDAGFIGKVEFLPYSPPEEVSESNTTNQK